MKRRRVRILSIVALAASMMIVAVGCAGVESAQQREQVRIAGGGVTGIYYSYGTSLAEALSAHFEASFAVLETDGSVDNLKRVGSGEATLGFAQSDAAIDAISGVGAFEKKLPIQAAARLYDEYVHVVVRADSDLFQLADLHNRSVSLGRNGSGVNVVATRALQATGVEVAKLHDKELTLNESIEALQQSEIDAFFWVGGLPTPGIVKLAEGMSIRMIPIDAQTVQRINETNAGVYRAAEFPAGMYGSTESTATMTVPNLLVVAENAQPEFVRGVLEVLFDSQSDIARQVPAAALLDRRQAIFTSPIDLHPGAIAYFRETRR